MRGLCINNVVQAGQRPIGSPRNAAALLLATGLVAAGCAAPRSAGGWDSAAFTVMTYNLFVDRRDFETAESVIRKADADVVFLQEVTTDWEPTLSALRRQYPYQASAPDEVGRGNALLSRLPLEDVRRLPARHGWHGAWFAEVETPLGEVQLLGVHLTPPLTDDQRFTLGALLKTGPIHRREIESFCDEIDFDEPLIVLGDFNENEGGAAASWLRRQRLRSALASYDLFSPTWAWVEAPLVSGRLDHVFHCRKLQPIHAEVVAEGVSDHRPVLAAFHALNHPAVADTPAGASKPQPAADRKSPDHNPEPAASAASLHNSTDKRHASAVPVADAVFP